MPSTTKIFLQWKFPDLRYFSIRACTIIRTGTCLQFLTLFDTDTCRGGDPTASLPAGASRSSSQQQQQQLQQGHPQSSLPASRHQLQGSNSPSAGEFIGWLASCIAHENLVGLWYLLLPIPNLRGITIPLLAQANLHVISSKRQSHLSA